MSDRVKRILLILVIGAAGILLLRPYLGPFFRSSGDAAFSTTDNPRVAIENALTAGEPLFIEFYSDT